MTDREANRFSARAARYARVGANMSGVAARIAGARLFGSGSIAASNAAELAAALGGLKGPIMKVAQLIATIPDALPPEYAAELTKLQSEAPPMGWAFVKRRMAAELGPRLADEVRRLRAPSGGRRVARPGASRDARTTAPSSPASCNIPTCSRPSKRTCGSSQLIFAIHRRMDPVIDTSEIVKEIGARVREELDYGREAKHVALYRTMLDGIDADPRAAGVAGAVDRRLLTLDWLEGRRLLEYKERRLAVAQPARHGDVQGLVAAVQPLRRDPRRSASRQLHGVRARTGAPPASTCSTTAASASSRRNSSAAWSTSITACCKGDDDRIVHAYETWGFKRLNRELIDILNIWARFIYGPLLEDRVRSHRRRRQAGRIRPARGFRVHQALKKKGPVTVPREFVFMDRAAIGLGGVFLHLRAELNFYRLFNEAIEGFSVERRGRAAERGARCGGLDRRRRASIRSRRLIRARRWRRSPHGAVALPRQLR